MSDEDPYGQGITIITLEDPPNAETLSRSLADLGGLVGKVVLPYASETERNATLVGPVAPTPGTATWLVDVERLEVYTGTGWLPMNPPLETSDTGATAASGFTLVSWWAYRSGRCVTINLCSSRTGSFIGSDEYGNIADTLIATIPAGWRPPEMLYGTVGDGFGHGEASIGTDGQVIVRAWSNNPNNSTTNGGIVAGRNIRLTLSFIQPE